VKALGELRQAVLGFELWAFDEELTPRVMRVSEYVVTFNRPWSEVVVSSVQSALDGLGERVPDGIWVNLTWQPDPERPG
jgi:hypothetical protein